MEFDVDAAANDVVADARLGDLECMCACVLEAWGGASGTGVDGEGAFYRPGQSCCCKRCRTEPRCRHQTDQTGH